MFVLLRSTYKTRSVDWSLTRFRLTKQTHIHQNPKRTKASHIMSLSEDDDYIIKVYCTVDGLTEDAIYELLLSDALKTVEEVKELFSVKFMPDERPLRVLEHHSCRYSLPGLSEKRYLLIIDSVDAAKHGVLLCNVDAKHGFPDALRVLPGMVGLTAALLGVANSDWTEVREGVWYEQQPPVRRLAVYDNRKDADRDSFHSLADDLDVGAHYVNPDEIEPRELGSIDDLFRYMAISPDNAGSLDEDELVKQHQRYAEEKNLDPERFAVVDDKFTTEGVSLMVVQPRKELRCRGSRAGELLYWHAIGFISDWQEVRGFVPKRYD